MGRALKKVIEFSRVQRVQIELLREPTDKELDILLGKDDNLNMFCLPIDLINFDDEEVINEDYSSNVHIYIPKAEIINRKEKQC